MKRTIATIATSLALLFSQTAIATPINASVSCAMNSCDITPIGGPVALDNTGFTIEADWSPQHIELGEPADDRGEWLLQMRFDVTGTVTASDSLETIGFSDFTDKNGVPILPIQFDDVNFVQATGTLFVNFEIFGPDTLSTFLAHGLNLQQSSFVALNGTTITSFAFRDADISTSMGTAVAGVWPTAVPEPTTLALIGLGLTAIALMRRRRKV
ncbi:MAG: PEP-CTERM sorting domain-containing protein [Pseudomonadota bacterium]